MIGRGLAAVVASGSLAAGLLTATIAAAFEDTTPVASTVQIAARPAGADRGRLLFQAKGCVACHGLAGLSSAQIGPDLTDLRGRAATRKPGVAADAYVRESIKDPQAYIVDGYGGYMLMPQLGLSDAEVDAVVAFLLASH